MRYLDLCAALALGEALALACGGLQGGCWPCLALAALTGGFGFGLAVPRWRCGVVFFIGMALVACSSPKHASAREKFWSGETSASVRCEARGHRTAFWRVRRALSEGMGRGLENDRATANLNRAIVLGEKNRLPSATRRIFVSAGAMHVFAISGLHVMVVARMLLFVMVALCLPLRFAGLAALPVLWAYVAMIGAPPSAVRAALMASFHCLAPVFFRKSDSLVAWAQTFLTVHLLNPRGLFEVGNALSFVVMLGILLWLRAAGELALGKRASALGVTVMAWASGVPIAAHVFGTLTPGGILANVVLIPAAGGSVFFGACGAVASLFSATLAAHCNNAAALFTRGMVGISSAVASLPGANLHVTRWNPALCVAWYVALLLVFVFMRLVSRRRRRFML